MSECYLDSVRCMCGGKIISTKVNGVHKAVCTDCAAEGSSDKSWGEAVGRLFLYKVYDYPEDTRATRLTEVANDLYAHTDCDDCNVAVVTLAYDPLIVNVCNISKTGPKGAKGIQCDPDAFNVKFNYDSWDRKIKVDDCRFGNSKRDDNWLRTLTGLQAPLTDSQRMISIKCDELKELLLEKNRKYGDSAINPCHVFSKASATEQILVRMDDKINRIKNRQNDEDEDVIKDLAGYCILYMIAKEKESE